MIILTEWLMIAGLSAGMTVVTILGIIGVLGGMMQQGQDEEWNN